MTQQALTLTLPGSDQRERIQREVRRILEGHAGRDRAIHRGTLARLVRENLGLHQLAQATLERRCREAIDELQDDGHRVVQTQHGIYIACTADEIAEGDRALAAPFFTYAKRLARYRRVRLSDVLQLAGQQSLGVGE